jgi:hypothetical protein
MAAARRQRPTRAASAAIQPEKPRVVVQFRPEFRIPYEDNAEVAVERLNAGPWKRLAECVFSLSDARGSIWAHEDQAASGTCRLQRGCALFVRV